MTPNILNFFIAYLQEKTSYMPKEMVRKHGLRILYLTTDFYNHLTNVILDLII